MPQQPALVNLSLQNLLQAEYLSQGDIKEIVPFISGCSVVDWAQLHLTTVPAVNDFLRVNGFNPNDLGDRERVRQIHQSAVEYLASEYAFKLPRILVNPSRIQNVFLIASGRSSLQKQACMLLKIMHVINHMEARKLLYRLTVSERMLFKEVESKVETTVENMRAIGFPVTEFAKSRKPRKSIITKILAKEKNTAAQVFDRVRFRIVAKEVSDIIPVLYYLKKKLIPFNYLIAGESRNNLLTRRNVFPKLLSGEEQILDDTASKCMFENEFTHPDYRVLSFVADIPLRIDRLLEDIDDPSTRRLGSLVFIPAEFQLYDSKSWQANESGPANHELYKKRQKEQVWKRITCGEPMPGGEGEETEENLIASE